MKISASVKVKGNHAVVTIDRGRLARDLLEVCGKDIKGFSVRVGTAMWGGEAPGDVHMVSEEKPCPRVRSDYEQALLKRNEEDRRSFIEREKGKDCPEGGSENGGQGVLG